MKLIIAEKPSVAMSICKVLGVTNRKDGYVQGNGYYVSWCVGHLVQLVNADSYDIKFKNWSHEDLPIIPQKWKYTVSTGKEERLRVLSMLMKKDDVDTIICATDAGREGELIFRLVYEYLKCTKPIQRLWTSSLEDEAIRQGFQNLQNGKNYDNLYQAALCRAKADWIVGINATRLFSTLFGLKLNVGRVMSPTLAMIVGRNADIQAFEPVPFYNVVLECENGTTFSSERMNDSSQAQAILNACQNETLFIEKVENKIKAEKPPKLYDLTTLQREASRRLGFTAKQTLQYTQSLYEKKLCTYPRTDSRFLTDDMQNGIDKIIDISMAKLGITGNAPSNTSLVINSSKVSDHHAIIPTKGVKDYDIDSLGYGEKVIIQLIMSKLLCAVGDNHKISETIITAKCADNIFTTKGKTLIENGFKDFILTFENNKENKTQDKSLPIMAEGEVLEITSAQIKQGKTSPPKDYTDDTLLSAMENANNAEVDTDMKGIGTPATRADIIEKLIKAEFIERNGEKKTKKFIPTEKGISLITVLPEEIQSPLLTAEWEEKLELVAAGEMTPDEFLNEIIQMTTTLVDTYEPAKGSEVLFPKQERVKVGVCPRCGEAVYEIKKGFCCNNRNCKFAIWKQSKFFLNKKKKVTPKFMQQLLADGKAPLKGCSSTKSDKKYDCMVFLDDDGGEFVNLRVEFGKK